MAKRTALDELLLQAQQRQLSESECDAIRRMVSRAGQDQPPPQEMLPSQRQPNTIPMSQSRGPTSPNTIWPGRAVAANDPSDFRGRPADPKRLSPRESIFKTGEAELARRQNVGQDQDPSWIAEILQQCREHMHPDAHAKLRAGLHGLHARGYAPAETEMQHERGELREEDPDGLDRRARPAMDAVLKGLNLPRVLTGFDMTRWN